MSTRISELGEFGLIRRLTEDIELTNESTIKGVGDDAAVIDFKDKQTLGLQGCSCKFFGYLCNEWTPNSNRGFDWYFATYVGGISRGNL